MLVSRNYPHSKALVDHINASIQTFEKNGTLNAILQRYIQ